MEEGVSCLGSDWAAPFHQSPGLTCTALFPQGSLLLMDHGWEDWAAHREGAGGGGSKGTNGYSVSQLNMGGLFHRRAYFQMWVFRCFSRLFNFKDYFERTAREKAAASPRKCSEPSFSQWQCTGCARWRERRWWPGPQATWCVRYWVPLVCFLKNPSAGVTMYTANCLAFAQPRSLCGKSKWALGLGNADFFSVLTWQ